MIKVELTHDQWWMVLASCEVSTLRYSKIMDEYEQRKLCSKTHLTEMLLLDNAIRDIHEALQASDSLGQSEL